MRDGVKRENPPLKLLGEPLLPAGFSGPDEENEPRGGWLPDDEPNGRLPNDERENGDELSGWGGLAPPSVLKRDPDPSPKPL